MSRLTQWLDHRREVVGFEKWKDLADFSGIDLQTLRDAQAYHSLDMLSRSELRRLAAALRVSVRKLEELNCGEIDWIEDTYFYDAVERGRPAPIEEKDPDCWQPKDTTPEDRGTPVLGRIKHDGEAETDEDWQEECGRHLPARFGKGYDIYALELEGEDQAMVFRNVPPWEFQDGSAAVYCWNGWEARGLFGRVHLSASKASVITPDGQRHELDPVNVVRIGKTISRWPAQAEAPDWLVNSAQTSSGGNC